MLVSTYDAIFAQTGRFEGDYSDEPSDPGNWTGGKVGAGVLGGTKYGQSSKAYADNLAKLPADIRATMPATVKDLTLDQVKTIFRFVYWEPIHGDDLPPPLAMLVYDAAVNDGAERAIEWLQQAVGAHVDGVMGPETLKLTAQMIARQGGAAIAAEFLAQRLYWMTQLATWQTFGRGWSRRFAALPFAAMRFDKVAS